MSYLDKLRISPITIVLEFNEGFKPEAFSGDTIRRMLENRFRQIDIIREKSGYTAKPFFRAKVAKTASNDNAAIEKPIQTPPRGYALAVTMNLPENTLYVHISLFGYFREALPYLMPQFQQMFTAQFGDTISLIKFIDAYGRPLQQGIPLHEISLAEMQQARLNNNYIGLHFVTPSLLYHRQNYDGQMRFQDVIKKLHQRAMMISHYYCDGPEPLTVSLLKETEQVKVSEVHLKWHYSKPQDKNYSLMGYIGYLQYIAGHEILHEHLPLLLLGQWLQIGEKTNFGGGKFFVEEGHYAFL